MMKKLLPLLLIFIATIANAQTDLWGGRTATQGKTFLVLSNVENTALSTWPGTSNITTLGTITGGIWNGTAITVGNGGTGLTTATTAYGVVCAGTTATGNFQVLNALGSSGQVLTSNGASALPTWQAVSGYTKNTITADQTAAVNNSYVNNKSASRCVVTLPGTAAVGDHIKILGYNSNGWKLAQPASVAVHWSGNSSTTGTSGYVQSNSQYDVIEVECIVANTDWDITIAQGQLTVN
jgi:hypothetical protein